MGGNIFYGGRTRVNNKYLVLLLMFGLLLLTGVPVEAGENSVESDSGLLSPSVKLSPFINIWLDDVDNIIPAVAYNNRHNEYMVVWYNIRGGGATRDIYARRVRADGTLLSSFTITHNANFWNYNPDIAYSPKHDEYLVVWTYDSVITDSDTWARRVKWDGSWMSSEFAIGRPDKSGKQVNPAVAYNSQADEYLVVYENNWGGSKDIDAQRVRASDGMLLSWRNIATGTGQLRSFPDVAYSPGNNYYLIAYTYQSSMLDRGDILGKVTSWNMGYLSAEIEICSDANHQWYVSLAGSSDEFLAVWEDSPSCLTTEIYARRIAGDGTPLGPSRGFWIAGSPGGHEGSPYAASGAASGYMIVWHRYIPGSNHDVFARFVMKGMDSAFNSEFTLDNDVAEQMFPVAACSKFGDCLMVEADNNSVGGDFEIRGRMVMFDRIYLPLSIRGY